MKNMLIAPVLAVFLIMHVGCKSTRSGAHNPYWSASDIKRSCLQQTTVPEIEAGKNAGMPVPEASAGWKNFKNQVLPGDQVWYFCVAPLLVKGAIGWRGYALYRNENLIATFTVADN